MIFKRTAWFLMIAATLSFAACNGASNADDEKADQEYKETRDSMLDALENDQSMEMDTMMNDSNMMDTSMMNNDTTGGNMNR